jgi:osomolarity two-component system response regulator SSK1
VHCQITNPVRQRIAFPSLYRILEGTQRFPRKFCATHPKCGQAIACDKPSMAIGELKTRLRAKFSRRHSTASSLSQSSADGEQTPATPAPTRKNPRSLRSRHSQRPASTFDGATIDEKESPLHGVIEDEAIGPKNEVDERDEATSVKLAETSSDLHLQAASPSTTFAKPLEVNLDDQKHDSSSATADFPTPNTDIPAVREEDGENEGRAE